MSSEIDPLYRSFTYSRLNDSPLVVLELKANDKVKSHETSCSTTKAILRFVLVIDVSGSMQSPYGTNDEISKLDKMKVFAESLTQHLRPEDELGLVCFGTKAEVIHRLSPLTNETKEEAVQKIQNLDIKGSTNLSDGLFSAVELFKHHSDGALYHDKIILFTDGEANGGVTEAEKLRPLLTQRMNEVADNCGYGSDYRISISVFSTGGFLPDLIIKIGEKFSNEAFYFLNENTMLEQELFKSVVLHEATAVKCAKVVVRTLNGVHFNDKETSKEYLEANSDSEDEDRKGKTDWKMAEYFIDSLPFGMPKHLLFGLVLPVDHEHCLKERDVLKVDLRYKGINGQRYKHTEIISYSKIPCDELATKEKSLIKNGQQIVRKKASKSLGRAAKKLRKRGRFDTIKEIQSGIVDIQQACEVIKDCLTDNNIIKMGKFGDEIVACLNGCLKLAENQDEEIADIWATLKAEASCLARETPVSTIFKETCMQPFQLPKELQDKLGRHLGKVCEIYKNRGLQSTSAIKYICDSIHGMINTGDFANWQMYMRPILGFLEQCEAAAVQSSDDDIYEPSESTGADLPEEIRDSCKKMLGLVFTMSSTGHQSQLKRVCQVIRELKSDVEKSELSAKLSKRRAKSVIGVEEDDPITHSPRRTQSESAAVGKLSKNILEMSESLLLPIFSKKLSSREQQDNCQKIVETNFSFLSDNNDEVL